MGARSGLCLVTAAILRPHGLQAALAKTLVEAMRLLIPSLSPTVCQELSALCDFLATCDGQVKDLSSSIFMTVVNIICMICFSVSYKEGDMELVTIRRFTTGFVNSLSDDNLVDIFPWLKVSAKPPHPQTRQTGLCARLFLS